jgi:hypothetical protein
MRCERILNYYIINILGSHKRNFVPPAQNMLYKVNAKSANTKQQKILNSLQLHYGTDHCLDASSDLNTNLFKTSKI